MQRLIPLKVPWQVSPSTPFLRLFAGELSSTHPTQVVFVAHFGLREGRSDQQKLGFFDAECAVDPLRLAIASEKESRVYSLVRMEFKGGVGCRMSPAFSDREVLNAKEFDPSLVPYSNGITNIGGWLSDFQSLWLKSGNCPDPCVYTIESSDWLQTIGLEGLEHFVIKGHDAYIEVLARNWKWEEIDKLPGL